ncbi:MAG: DUF3179 domain-containing (seleno)protein [Gemmatimonadales bacterium]
MCHSGVGLTPVIDGRVHHFSAGGLYDGLVLLIDDETGTYWDHIRGEAVYGPIAGEHLARWAVTMTNAAAALADHPDLQLARSRPAMRVWLMGRLYRLVMRKKGFLPPGFRKTMGEMDDRLPHMTHGLGVVHDGEARFYPMAAIDTGLNDSWGGRIVHISIGERDHIPSAHWENGERPFQLFTRWYGFAYTYPGCTIGGTT